MHYRPACNLQVFLLVILPIGYSHTPTSAFISSQDIVSQVTSTLRDLIFSLVQSDFRLLEGSPVALGNKQVIVILWLVRLYGE